MGRGVSYANYSKIKVYYHLDEDIMDDWYWDDFVNDLVYDLQQDFPSLDHCDKWLDREDHALLCNNFAYVGVSEYCGVVCLWFTPRWEYDGQYWDYSGMANAWFARIADKVYKKYGDMTRLGTFSNGESVYQLKLGLDK